MPLKQTIITRVQPDSPGWYWFQEPDAPWQPAQVILHEGKLCVRFYTDPDAEPEPIGLADITGSWGDEIPLPKSAHTSQTTERLITAISPKEKGTRRANRRPIGESKIIPEQLAKFLYWISERHQIYLHRHTLNKPGLQPVKNTQGKFPTPKSKQSLDTALLPTGEYSYSSPKPWTKDLVLQSNFFCNAFRELDKTTQWFRENVRGSSCAVEAEQAPSPLLSESTDAIMATIIFRWFNFIPTAEALLHAPLSNDKNLKPSPGGKGRKLSQPSDLLGLFTNWDSSEAMKVLKPMKKVFTGAHVVASGTQLPDTGSREGGESPKLRSILDLIDRMWDKREELITTLSPSLPKSLKSPNPLPALTLQASWEYLIQFPAIGPFMAYEIVTDLRHTCILRNAPDILTWANAGPGAMRGLNRIFGRDINFASPAHNWQQEMQMLLVFCSDHLLSKPISTTNLSLLSLPANFVSDGQSDAIKSHVPPIFPLPKGHPAFELREVESSLCEFDKYQRIASPDPTSGGPQNSKRKYAGV